MTENQSPESNKKNVNQITFIALLILLLLLLLSTCFFKQSETNSSDVQLCGGRKCPENSICQNDMCLCSDKNPVCGTKCCGKMEMCLDEQNSTCVPVSGKCGNNADCAADEYCRIMGEYDAQHTQFCYHNFVGQCKKKGSLPNGTPIPELNTTVYDLNDYNSWWAARNLCLSHGKKMFSIDNNRFDCFDKTLGQNGTNQDGYCNADITGLDGNNQNAVRSTKMLAFKKAVGDMFDYWTTSGINQQCSVYSCNACNAFSIQSYNGKFSTYYGLSSTQATLCE